MKINCEDFILKQLNYKYPHDNYFGSFKISISLSMFLWQTVTYIHWRRTRQPTPVFLLGESHRQRSLAGYSPQGLKESDATEAT